MPSVAPTNLAPLPRLLAYTQTLGLQRYLVRAKRGIPTLVPAWRGTGRPHRLGFLGEPRPAALLGRSRLPAAQTLHRSLNSLSATDSRAAVEAAYLAALPRPRVQSGWRSMPARFPIGGAGGSSR